MSHLRPRWRRALRHLATSKTRTALVALSPAVGVFTGSLLINAESVVHTAFDRKLAA